LGIFQKANYMTATDKIYQSILHDLSEIPVDQLQQVSAYLQQLQKNIKRKENNRSKILALSGSWDEMPEEDFKEYLKEAKSAGNEAFGREIDL